MDGFREGVEFFEKNNGALLGSFLGGQYIDKVELEIDKTIQSLNNFNGTAANISTLKGDVAEFWHAGTFNIKASVRGSNHRLMVDRSHDFGSVDVSGKNFDLEAGLKFYKNGVASAKQQSKNVFERYKEYQAQGGKDSIESFLGKRGYSDTSALNSAVYEGQVRIIPADQLKDAIAYLEKKIAKESVNRPELVPSLKETLAMLTDRVSDNNGVESIPLTEADSRRIAQLAKEGVVDPEKLGLTTENLIQNSDIIREAFKSGTSAAVISLVLRTAPEILKAISYLIQNGKIDEQQYKAIGLAAVTGASEGFIRGCVSAALTTSCQSGLLGLSLKEINPSVIGMVTVVAMNTIQNSFKVAKGEMTRQELTNELVKQMFVSTCSLCVGGISQGIIEIPVLGFMIGSFIGSIIGSVAYSAGYSAVMSFCVDSGFTMFGLVDQNYELPKEVLEEIGIEVFEYEKFEYEKFEYEKFEHEKFDYEEFEYEKFDILFLRRGVIGVGKIGYI